MKKLLFTMASLVMLASASFAQEEPTPMLPSQHGLTDHQPAWGSSQTFDLAAGWNWWSTYITGQDITDLEAALGESALQIKGKANYVSYTNGAWQGLLSGTVENKEMYSIQMSEATEVTLRGSRANATDVAITGSAGWNWVGFPVNTPMTVAYALQDYTATAGDIFKSNGPFATFDGNVWVGTLTAEGQYVQPGLGYKMLSSNTSGFSFYYPSVPEENGRAYVASQYTTSTEWQPVMASNPTNMNMIAVVNFDGEELRSENVEIGVFNGETCRGAIHPMYVESIDRYVVFLTMYGEDNEPFSFRLLNEMGDVYESNEVGVSYQADAVVGALRAPFELKFNAQNVVASNLHLFPNPVKRGETVNMTLPCEGTLTVVNMLGSTVKSMNVVPGPAELSANMTPGIYTVKVTDAEGNVYVNKLVVK